jgi:hypothetical protein
MLQQVAENLVIALQGFVKRIKFEIVLEALLNLNEVEPRIDRRGSGGSRVPEQENTTIAEPVGEKNYRKHDDENASEHLLLIKSPEDPQYYTSHDESIIS